MPRYRVRDGATVGISGTVHEAGAVVDLSRELAADMALAALVDEVDAAGNVLPPTPPDDLARFKTHERVGILQGRLADAQAKVTQIQQLLAAEEQALAAAVRASTASPGPVTAPAKTNHPAPAPSGVKQEG
jgi:hypothetical protein